MAFLKKNYYYFLIFFVFLFLSVVFFYENCSFDVIWNYGFSHAIRIGKVPYRDFNIISTPLYPFIMSIGLFIKDDIFTFMLEHSLLVTFLFYLLIKQFKAKGLILAPIFAFFLFLPFNATYNFFAFFLIVLLFYLEKNASNDYLIGFILGLLIITKQTIGLSVLFFSFLGLRNLPKIGKRLLTASLPCLCLLIYLLITKSLSSFLDLCFLGLLDFGTKNHTTSFTFLTFLAILLFLVLVIKIYKEKNNLLNYYILGSFSFLIPIIDLYHFGLFLGLFSLLFLEKIPLPSSYIGKLSLVLLSLICLINLLIVPEKFTQFTFFNKNHFHYYGLKETDKKTLTKVLNKYQSYQSKNVYMLDPLAMFYDITTNHNITYFDVLLTGNYGYHGTTKMLKKVKNMHKTYFFLNKDKSKNQSTDQFDTKITKYIINNTKKCDHILNYDIYYKE